MKTPFTGGCVCGAVRYECRAKPITTGNCHCRDCQQITGTAFASALLVPRDAVTIIGEVKYFDMTANSGRTISRGFCPNCGSRLFGKRASADFMSIMAGSLDDPSEFRPAMDVFTASAQLWDYMDPALPKFSEAPPPSAFVAE